MKNDALPKNLPLPLKTKHDLSPLINIKSDNKVAATKISILPILGSGYQDRRGRGLL